MKAGFTVYVTFLTLAFITVSCTSQSPVPAEKSTSVATQALAEAVTPDPIPTPLPEPSPTPLPTSSPTPSATPIWTSTEIKTLRSLWLGSLPPLPPDPSNDLADDPRAAALGYKIFFDKRFSANGEVACATCHKPELKFTDDLPLAEAIGTTTRRTMPLVGAAYSPWFFWDGRKDSQWAQALEPMESPIEHGGTRTQYVRLIAEDETYRAEYEAIFGPLPDFSDQTRFPASAGPKAIDFDILSAWQAMTPEDQLAVTEVYANLGKAIAAYERLIVPGPSRFDDYVKAVLEGDAETIETELNADEVAGLRLFIGKAQCTNCHNGPLFTDNDFHSTGVPLSEILPVLDSGRALGVQQVLIDEFNCLSPYSDAKPGECVALNFVKTSGVVLPGGFKPPTLRNVADRSPYMHAGQFTTLRQVLTHYNEPPPPPFGYHQELRFLYLSETELSQLEAFLQTLSGPLATSPELLTAPEVKN